MTIGNWRSHLLIKCAVCSKLMSWHIPSITAVCVDCEIQEHMKKEMTREAAWQSFSDYKEV